MITKALLLDKGVVQFNNEYLDAYIDLINSNLDTPKQIYKTQSHHIIPEYYFIHLNIPIDNSNENKVNLLYRDHLLAHYYLFKCSKGNYKYSNSTVLKLVKKSLPFEVKDFDYVLDDNIMSFIQEGYEYAIMVESDHDSEAYQKRVAALKTPEHRKKQSEIIKLAYEEGRIKLPPGGNNSGMKAFNNGIKGVFAFERPEGFEEGPLLSEDARSRMGWSKGLTGERFNTIGGRIRINNGKNHKYVNEDELQSYLDTGEWFEGSLKFDTGQWYTNGEVNTKIVEGKEVPEGFYPGYTGTVNNMICTCIINDEKLEFNSKKDLFNYLFDNCTNKRGRNKAGWKTVSGLSGYVYKCIKKGKPIELEINGVLSKIEII